MARTLAGTEGGTQARSISTEIGNLVPPLQAQTQAQAPYASRVHLVPQADVSPLASLHNAP